VVVYVGSAHYLVRMNTHTRIASALIALALLASCGGSDDDDTSTTVIDSSTVRGTLIVSPPERVASFEPNGLWDLLLTARNGQSLRDAAGQAACGIDFHRLEYQTVGALEEPTAASGVLMIPTGEAPECSGPRPIVVYAHGTSTDKGYNLADVTNTDNAAFTESLMIAAVFAAHGYIVVAPNYAGYDTSTLGYHPYLNADQQSKEMIDALSAARKSLGTVAASTTTDDGRLYLTGYSQGGHVAMATHRAMQAAGQTVTASAPMSGPYALLAFLDRIVFGQVNLGATLFMPMATTSWQKAYGNLYSDPSEIYEAAYATGIETLLPSTTPIDDLINAGKLPREALFSSTTPTTGDATLDILLAVPSNETFARGFGNPNLVTNSLRVAYARDANANPDGANTTPPQSGAPQAATVSHPLRAAAQRNDLRNWQPASPTMLCGGNADPTVFWDVNANVMQSYWAALPSGRVSLVDLDSLSTGASDPYASQRSLFAAAKAALDASGGAQSVTDNYHVTLAVFCTASARLFFEQR
jgi:poly(3-hydroxybutyrate) depolymerase